VTINLAPADIRKEGSAFGLPMALGLTGCMGQFFAKPLDKMMFLGQLSLGGTVRPIRGALSATLAHGKMICLRWPCRMAMPLRRQSLRVLTCLP